MKYILNFILVIIIFLNLISCNKEKNIDYTACLNIQFKELNNNDIDFINTNKIIILNDFELLEIIDNILFAKIIIHPDLIKDSKDRYYIAHYIRNRLLKDYREYTKNEVIHPKLYFFDNYQKYIKENNDKIIKVIYYLLSKRYCNLTKKLKYQADLLLSDELLGDSLNKLKDKLIEEGSYSSYIIKVQYK